MAEEHDFYAILRPESPRHADWVQVFETEALVETSGVRVPITTPIAERVRLPIGVRQVLFVATDLLTPSQKARLILYLAVRFNQDPQEVQDAIEADPRHSVPILDEDLSVVVLHPQKWF
jgi:hypothetical protein